MSLSGRAFQGPALPVDVERRRLPPLLSPPKGDEVLISDRNLLKLNRD
jgi:hypothetical protein